MNAKSDREDKIYTQLNELVYINRKGSDYLLEFPFINI